jgi:hypothetical protein
MPNMMVYKILHFLPNNCDLLKVFNNWPVSAFHILILLSQPLDKIFRSLAENDTIHSNPLQFIQINYNYNKFLINSLLSRKKFINI